jgi:hypothetical protein
MMLTAREAREIVNQSLIPDLAELEVKIEEAAKKGFGFINLNEDIWHSKNRNYERTYSLVKLLKEFGYTIEYAGNHGEMTVISW